MAFDPPADTPGQEYQWQRPDPPPVVPVGTSSIPSTNDHNDHLYHHDPSNTTVSNITMNDHTTTDDIKLQPQHYVVAHDKPFGTELDDSVDEKDTPHLIRQRDEGEDTEEQDPKYSNFCNALDHDDAPIETVPTDEFDEDHDSEHKPSLVYCAPAYEGDEEAPSESAGYGEEPSTSTVYVNVYDLSIANTLCCHWIGCGQYHTGVVVFGTEHHYNPAGVESYTPRNVINARWRTQINRGTFTGTYEDVAGYVNELSKEYRRNKYNMLFRNANHFSNALLDDLNGSKLPKWITRTSDWASGCCKCCIPPSIKKNVKTKDWLKHDPRLVQGIYGSNVIVR